MLHLTKRNTLAPPLLLLPRSCAWIGGMERFLGFVKQIRRSRRRKGKKYRPEEDYHEGYEDVYYYASEHLHKVFVFNPSPTVLYAALPLSGRLLSHAPKVGSEMTGRTAGRSAIRIPHLAEGERG
ncbi:hypothetical protein SRHO_G00003150 [Serrasalmus rhombeus]